LLQAFDYIVITVIFNKSLIFGLFEVGGFLVPSLGNSLLLLWLRMLFVVPLTALVSTILYPPVWQDIKQFVLSKDWFLFLKILGSGFFLFLSQVLLYQALGAIAPGIAIGIFFIYPILSVLLAWVLFGVRPTLVSNLVIFSVLAGFVLMTLPGSSTNNFSDSGVGPAAGASIAFALYVILSQTSAQKLNPIPLSLMNFVIILAFSGLSLAGPVPQSWKFDVLPSMWLNLIASILILSGLTLFSYFLNNLGIRKIDAAKASVLGATVPALTALLALVTIQSHLLVAQVFGLLLITLGVAALSFERWQRYTKRNQSTTKKVTSS
jgi:drug/metabolite transporter (DMT)-like permease